MVVSLIKLEMIFTVASTVIDRYKVLQDFWITFTLLYEYCI
jgi:hypothetical protein